MHVDAASTLTANVVSLPEKNRMCQGATLVSAAEYVTTVLGKVAFLQGLLTAAVAPALLCHQKLQKQVQLQQ